MALTPTQLRDYALRGAALRLQAIADEIAAILKAFPNLRDRHRRVVATALADTPTRRTRRKLTAAERKKLSDAMRAHWVERRKKRSA